METAVSKFIVTMCSSNPRPNINRYYGIRPILGTMSKIDGSDCTRITVCSPSGSASELYIKSLLPIIGDIDIMWFSSNELVVPHGYHVTDWVQLPVEFHTSDEIELSEFSETKFPGYVFIRLIGKLIKERHSDNYKFVRSKKGYLYTTTLINDTHAVYHGPAQELADSVRVYSAEDGQRPVTLLSSDSVRCMRCLQWPPQAADWATRLRHNLCPDSANIQRVVNNGCDLVWTTHRRCKGEEFYRERMWRISFSRAETTLLNTWTPKQQTVYHVLRYVFKKEGFIESEQSKCGLFSNYHLKTLMLWSCELHSRQWWTLSLVRITTELLHVSANVLKLGELEQYFITQCNILDYSDEFDSAAIEFVCKRLLSMTVAGLSEWLFDNYVQECAKLCPTYVQQLMNKASSITQFEFVLSTIVNERFGSSHVESCIDFLSILRDIERILRETRSVHIPAYQRFIESLQEVDGRLEGYSIALIFLHVTKLLEQGQDNCELFEVIAELMQISKSRVSSQTISRSSSKNTPFSKAADILIKLKTGASTYTMIQVELAKAFLHISLDNADIEQAHEDCSPLVYLACLYYSTEQYQSAFDQLLLATESTRTQCSSNVVEIHLLPDNGDEIHVVSGLIALYQFMTQRTSSCQQSPFAHVLTANLCSMFYMVKCGRRLVKNTRKILQRYNENVRQRVNLFIGDFLLMCILVERGAGLRSPRTTCFRTIAKSKQFVFNSYRLRCLLMQSAVERLTAVRHVTSRDYNSVCTVATSDYDAMYAYKCGEYERCLCLCQQMVNSLCDVSHVSSSLSLSSSDLLLLIDYDCLFVIGLCSLDGVYDVENNYEDVSQKCLSLYLLVQCKLKLKHSSKSFIDVLRFIMCEFRRIPVAWITDRLLLTLAYRRVRRRLH